MTKLTRVTTVALVILSIAAAAHARGPQHAKAPTPASEIRVAEALDGSHILEFGDNPPKNRLAAAWAQIALENGRGAAIWNNNLGNVGPSPRPGSKVAWYYHVPGVRFRSFATLEDAGRAYWRVIHRCSSALRAFDAGRPGLAARRLKRCGYYEADTDDYARAMRSLYYHALGVIVPVIERKTMIQQAAREAQELELRFPFTPACGCSRWIHG